MYDTFPSLMHRIICLDNATRPAWVVCALCVYWEVVGIIALRHSEPGLSQGNKLYPASMHPLSCF